MDTVREQLVKRPYKSSDSLIKYGIMAASILITVVIVILFSAFGGPFIMFGIILSALVLWGGYYFSGLTNVEYEYCIAGSDFSVDKIVNQSKRKTLCSFNLKSASGFYKTKKQTQDATVIECEGEGEVYTIEYNDPKYGKTFVHFSPDERTLAMISPYLPRLS